MCRCIEDRVRKREYSSTFSERSFSVILSFKSMISCSVSRRKHTRWIWMFSKTTNDPPILRNGFWHSQHSHGISCPVSFRLCNSSQKSQGYEDDEDVVMKTTKTSEDVVFITKTTKTSTMKHLILTPLHTRGNLGSRWFWGNKTWRNTWVLREREGEGERGRDGERGRERESFHFLEMCVCHSVYRPDHRHSSRTPSLRHIVWCTLNVWYGSTLKHHNFCCGDTPI